MPIFDLARAAEDRFHRDLIPVLRQRGWRPRVVPYDGYGTISANGLTSSARVIARMVMRPQNAPAEGPLFRSLPEDFPTSALEMRDIAFTSLLEAQRGWRSFVDCPVPFLPVTVKVGNQSLRTRADRSGYVDVVVRDHGLEPGWHNVTIEAAGVCEPVTCQVEIVCPEPTIGVICDIDDTAMITHMPRAMVAAWNAFVKNSGARQPVPGMAQLLSRVRRTHPQAPVVYLSTGAWNVVPTLRFFLKKHGFPRGPMLMTDWGPNNTGWFRSGIEHKRTQLRRLMIDLPHVTWLLLGDDGQYDPLIYGEAAREHDDHVAAVAIRRLSPGEHVLAGGRAVHPMGLDPDSRTLAECDVPVVYGTDGFALARALPSSIVGPDSSGPTRLTRRTIR
ncbi:App1 family protein [Actinomyces vulturis]|uniref:App1 family protein n=1 Tax=Actinomyces vulturis TaxID=1857645 RepID=UPI0008337ACC|nr:phosphatase domain-containing protein [Actinomyces vulturis]